MRKGLRNVVVLGLLGLGLSGCHTFSRMTHSCQNEKDTYRKAVSVPPIRVPLGLDPPDTKSALQIPALNEPALPPRGPKDPCLDEPPKFTEPKGPRPAPSA
jgi:uncharacterized lipoprotein